MLGAIIGDIAGSYYEWNSFKTENTDEIPIFHPESHFTDDSVLTIAVSDALLDAQDGGQKSFHAKLQKYTNRYPNAGYGSRFREWALRYSERQNNSYGNGAAMRVSPVAYAAKDLDDALRLAQETAAPSHNHPEAIKGAQAVAGAIYLAAKNNTKDEIINWVESYSGYEIKTEINAFRKKHRFETRTKVSVPAAFIAFRESTSFLDAIRIAISLGGDADTEASIAGAIAEAYYKSIPVETAQKTIQYLPDEFIETIENFYEEYVEFPLAFGQISYSIQNAKRKCDIFI